GAHRALQDPAHDARRRRLPAHGLGEDPQGGSARRVHGFRPPRAPHRHEGAVDDRDDPHAGPHAAPVRGAVQFERASRRSPIVAPARAPSAAPTMPIRAGSGVAAPQRPPIGVSAAPTTYWKSPRAADPAPAAKPARASARAVEFDMPPAMPAVNRHDSGTQTANDRDPDTASRRSAPDAARASTCATRSAGPAPARRARRAFSIAPATNDSEPAENASEYATGVCPKTFCTMNDDDAM